MARQRPSKPPSTKPDDDRGLWDRVKRTVDPLDAGQRALYSQALSDFLDGDDETGRKKTGQEKAHPKPVKVNSGALRPHPKGHPEAHTRRPPTPASPKLPNRPPLVSLDRKTRSRIAKGRTPIDGRLDLHGLRQHEAHDVLRSFVLRSHAKGHRTVLVITGKGSRQRDPHPDDPPWAVGSGILKRAVPGWLAAPDLRFAVLSVEAAHQSHGGEGALYVRLRAKPSGPVNS